MRGKWKREKVMSLIVGMKQGIRQLRAAAWAVGAFGAAGLMAAAPAQASMSNCVAGGGSWTNWTVNPTARLLNGQVLATATATLQLTFRVDQAFSFGADEEYRSGGWHANTSGAARFNSTYMALPLTGSPEVGLRVSYGGTNTIRTTRNNPAAGGAPVDVNVRRITPAAEIGVYRSTGPYYLALDNPNRPQVFTRFVFGGEHAGVTFVVEQTWHYELVLLGRR